MHETIITAICRQFPGVLMSRFRNETRFMVPPDGTHDFLETLKTSHGFDMLVDLTCVDYLDYPIGNKGTGSLLPERPEGCFAQKTPGTFISEKGDRHLLRFVEEPFKTFSVQKEPVPFFDRFGLVYVLADTVSNRRVMVRTFLGEVSPSVPTVFDLWRSADWLEREVWDLFGIRFEGHPDLRRIVLPEEFQSHPLRKDYPLQGRGERHHLPVISRKEG